MFMNFMKVRPVVIRDEKGQGMVEYALIISGIAIVVFAIFAGLSGGLTATFQSIIDSL